MVKYTPAKPFFFSILLLLFILLSSINNALADDPPVTLPLPGMPDGSHVCGTSIVLDIIDLDDFNSDQQNRPQLIDPNGDDPEVGDRRNFNVVNFEDSGTTTEYDEIEFELRAISEHSEIWVDINEWEDPIDQSVVDAVLKEQDEQTAQNSWNPDRGIIDIGQELFGDPPDFDGSGRLKTLLVDIQDGWSEEEGGGFIAGYFNPGDQSSLYLNSNQADIIYINTYPGMYREGEEPDASQRFGTLAHEYQHLIHHRYGNLNTFQNEGQSEFAELIKGYDARTMHWLEKSEEIDGTAEVESGPEGLYRWRRYSSDVLMDYQRAQLLHSYVYERTDAETAAGVTRASSSGKEAYLEALNEYGVEWETFLTDFQITNRANNPEISDERYSYNLPQLTDVSAGGIGNTHSGRLLRTERALENETVEVYYGGGFYSKFEEPENLEIELQGDDYVKWAAILEGGDTGAEVKLLDEGTEWFDGVYDEIVLVGANTREEGLDEENPGSRTYEYSYEYGVVSQVAEDVDYPQEFELGRAYPNPFNPATGIQYKLPEEAEVQLTVYDVTGRQIATLVDEIQPAGEYQITFEAADLASGTYIYRITANEWSDSEKMILVK